MMEGDGGHDQLRWPGGVNAHCMKAAIDNLEATRQLATGKQISLNFYTRDLIFS